MFTSLEADNLRCKTTTGINSRLVVVTKKEILQMLTFLEFFCAVTEIVYANTIVLFNLGEKWLLQYFATIHVNFI